jgi:hypothetical protein
MRSATLMEDLMIVQKPFNIHYTVRFFFTSFEELRLSRECHSTEFSFLVCYSIMLEIRDSSSFTVLKAATYPIFAWAQFDSWARNQHS